MNDDSYSFHIHLKDGEKPSKGLHKAIVAIGEKYGVKVSVMHNTSATIVRP